MVALSPSLVLDPSVDASSASLRGRDRPRRDPQRTLAGVALAALLCFGLSAYLAVRLPPFFGADERAHFSYSVSLLEGRLPEITDAQPFTDRYPIIERSLDPEGPGPPRRQGIFVAAHPPLAYALAAPAVWAAGQTESDELPTLAFRLANAVSMAIGVVLAGLFAGELFPHRRGVAIGAAALTAVVPSLLAGAAYALNDGPAFALTTGCLVVGTRILRRGFTAGRLGAASLVAAAALATRASAAVAVAAMVACAAVAAWRQGAGRRAAVGGAVGAALAVGATAVVAAGWFYWRNQRLYGTPTADTFLLEGLRREDRGTLIDALGDVSYQRDMWSGLYGVVHPRLSVWHPGWVVAGIAAVTAVGLAVAASRRVRARTVAPVGPATASDCERGIGVAGWVVVAGFCTGVVVATASFYADGGGPHPRYLLSVVPVVSALLARAVADLPRPRVALALVVGAQVAVTGSQIVQFPDLIGDPDHPRPFDQATAGPAAQWGALVLAAAAGVGLLALLCSDWWRSRGLSECPLVVDQ